MKLQIVIPALNEEDSIESIINRCLQAKPHIISTSPVTDIAITVVSDGSTDKTVEIARRYSDKIKLIVFEKNRGYGAAIKEGWRQSDAELLGFLDADGTCEPNFFADLCNLLTKKNADVVLGSRLNKNSKMPLIRRIGNILYSTLLSFVSFEKIKDTASGMRVVRRSSLPKLMPLPDGLHFTPAMSARAILSHDLKICEQDMTYHEREGQSKLKVFRDGVRFLNIILKMIFLYQPYKVLQLLAVLFLLFAGALMAYPILYYFENHKVLEWMVYRFIVAELAGITGMLLVSASYVAHRIVGISLFKGERKAGFGLLNCVFQPKPALCLSLLSVATATALVWKSVIERLTTGVTYEHWSRFVAASFFYTIAAVIMITVGIDYVLGLINERLRYLEERQRDGES